MKSTQLCFLLFLVRLSFLKLGDLIETLENPNPTAEARFGSSISEDQGKFVFGAENAIDMESKVQSGQVWLYDNSNISPLSSQSPEAQIQFGHSVSIRNEKTAVGANLQDSPELDHGSVSVFSGQTIFQVLTSQDYLGGEGYGSTVDLTTTDKLLITSQLDGGTVHVMEITSTTTNDIATISNPFPKVTEFGYSLDSLSDGKIVVGSPKDSSIGLITGAVYVYEQTGGPPVVTIRKNTFDYSRFGHSLSVTIDDKIIVGAPGSASVAGQVRIFDKYGTQQLVISKPGDIGVSSLFGFAVSGTVNGNILTSAPEEGCVYLHDGKNGVQLHKILNPNPSELNFGYDIYATSTGNFLIGSPNTVVQGTDGAGAVYVYQGDGLPSLILDENVLLMVTFDGDLTEWDFFDYDLVTLPSDWKISDGRLCQNSNTASNLRDLTQFKIGTVASYNDPGALQWKQHKITVTLNNQDDDTMGIVFYKTDNKNFYALYMDASKKVIMLSAVLDGVENIIKTASFTYQQNTDITVQIKVTFTGIYNQFDILVDDLDIFRGTITDSMYSQQLKAGTIGLMSEGSAGLCFDDLSVQQLPVVEEVTVIQKVEIQTGILTSLQTEVVSLGSQGDIFSTWTTSAFTQLNSFSGDFRSLY